MHLALYGFLRFCFQEYQFESIWLPPLATDKDFVKTKKKIEYPLTDSQILRLLNSFSSKNMNSAEIKVISTIEVTQSTNS